MRFEHLLICNADAAKDALGCYGPTTQVLVVPRVDHPDLSLVFDQLASQYAQIDTVQSSQPSRTAPTPHVGFVCFNDTHVRTFAGLIQSTDPPVSGRLIFSGRDSEGAASAAAELEAAVPCTGLRTGLLRRDWDVIACANDWGPPGLLYLSRARRLGVPTVVFQEGCLDFWDGAGRMERADFAVAQGFDYARWTSRRLVFVGANTRFANHPVLDPDERRGGVVANLNFTYGVHEEARAAWIASVQEACSECQVPVRWLVHPRDRGPLPAGAVRTHPGSIAAELAQADLLISRFSSVIFEAALMGVGVAYHNPHDEKMRTFRDDSSGFLLQSRDRASLVTSIRAALSESLPEAARDRFLAWHLPFADSALTTPRYYLRAIATLGPGGGTGHVPHLSPRTALQALVRS